MRTHGPGSATETFSRRGFIAAGSAAALTTAIAAYPASITGDFTASGAPTAAAAGTAALATQRRMLVQVAHAGTLFPLRLHTGGQLGRAGARRPVRQLRAAQHGLRPGLLRLGDGTRPSLAGLRAAERSLPADELALARSGAALMIGAGLLDSGHASVLAALGEAATTVTPADRIALQAAAALGVRSVFSHAAPGVARDAARQWLDLLASMHGRGTLRPAIHGRGIR